MQHLGPSLLPGVRLDRASIVARMVSACVLCVPRPRASTLLESTILSTGISLNPRSQTKAYKQIGWQSIPWSVIATVTTFSEKMIYEPSEQTVRAPAELHNATRTHLMQPAHGTVYAAFHVCCMAVWEKATHLTQVEEDVDEEHNIRPQQEKSEIKRLLCLAVLGFLNCTAESFRNNR